MPVPPPPSPRHLLRSHSEAISALYISEDNERLYSGDTSGLVVVTSTRTLRSVVGWKAHSSSLLRLREWGTRFIITHARDNKLHVWNRTEGPSSTDSVRGGSSATQPQSAPVPDLCYSLDVNALNFCAFSFLSVTGTEPDASSRAPPDNALIAVPNLVESSLADVWRLPSRERLHAAIGKIRTVQSNSENSTYETGIIMSLHLHQPGQTAGSSTSGLLQLLAGYENGSVEMWRFRPASGKERSVEGVGWESVWRVKLHVESVMAMAVSRDSTLALTVSADHLIGRYDLQQAEENSQEACTIHRTKHPGNASIVIHDTGKVCAVGGWDGKIRLYSTKSVRTLGKLDYHKTSCQAVVFTRSAAGWPHPAALSGPENAENTEDEDEDMDKEEEEARKRWLLGGGKDGRVSIWVLMDFQKN